MITYFYISIHLHLMWGATLNTIRYWLLSIIILDYHYFYYYFLGSNNLKNISATFNTKLME